MQLDDQFSFDASQKPGALTSDAIPGMPSFGDTAPKASSSPAPSFATTSPSTGDAGAFGGGNMSGDVFKSPSPAPAASAPGAVTNAGPAQPDFASMLADIQGATDPAQAAVKQDQLSRTLFTQLSAAGHDVKWQGDQLIVDGRPYVVGGGIGSVAPPASSTPGSLPGFSAYSYGGDPGYQTQVEPNYGEVQGPDPGPVMDGPSQPAPPGSLNNGGVNTGVDPNNLARPFLLGFDTAKLFDPSTGSAAGSKYTDDAKTFGQLYLSGVPISRGNLGPMVDAMHSKGFPDAAAVGDDKIDPDGPGPEAPIDVVGSDGSIRYQNTTDNPQWEATYGGGTGQPGGDPSYLASSPLAGGPPPAAAAPAAPSWMPGQGPQYTPGDIPMDDLPTFSYDDIYNQVVGGDATDDATSKLMQSILDNPDSIDAHTLDTMKAKSKDELAEQQQMDEQDLRRFGNASGIDDSNWLASERLASRRGRDQALVSGNRDLEVQAATQNAQDRRAAAQLGASYGAQKAQIRQAAATLASDTTLREAAARNDRLALRESVNQKAAELGISADQVMSSYLLGLADNATRLHGIDVSAQIDWSRLSEQSTEFKEDLAFRLSQLGQQAEQFNLNYGLDFSKFSHQVDEDNLSHYLDT